MEIGRKFIEALMGKIGFKKRRFVGCDPGATDLMYFVELEVDKVEHDSEGKSVRNLAYHFGNRWRYSRKHDCHLRKHLFYNRL
jgi:hypothetical protein